MTDKKERKGLMGEVTDMLKAKDKLKARRKKQKGIDPEDGEEFYTHIKEALDKAKEAKNGGFCAMINVGEHPDGEGDQIICGIHKLSTDELSSMITSLFLSHPEVAVHVEANMKIHAMGGKLPFVDDK